MCIGAHSSKSCLDSSLPYLSEAMIESLAPIGGFDCLGTVDVSYGSNQFYTYHCVQDCKNLFGCVGLKRKEFCILNKQYSKREYFELLPRVVDLMRDYGEWGEFFPARISPFPINETVNQLYHPFTEEEARSRGLWWTQPSHEHAGITEKRVNAHEVAHLSPEDLKGIVLLCSHSGRPYRLIQQEIVLYKDMGVPFPLLHPDERHKRRWGERHPYEMFNRTCSETGASLVTSYKPDSPYTIISNEAFRARFDS